MNDKIALAKGITKFVVGRSVGTVVATALRNNVSAVTRAQEVQVVVGSYVLGAMVADRAVEWTSQKFDETLIAIETFRHLHKEDKTTE